MLNFKGYQLVTFSWVLFALTTPIVLIRLYVQFRFRYRPWREIYVIAAWLFYLANTITYSLNNKMHFYEQNEDFYTYENPYIVDALKINLVTLLTYKLSIYACKAVLLCFYMDVTPRRFFPKTYWAIIATWICCIAGALLQELYPFISCRPLKIFWTLEHADCWNSFWFFVASWTFFLLTDVQVYTIPFFILYNLPNLTNKQKMGAYGMFSIGLVNIISAVFMLVVYLIPDFLMTNSVSQTLTTIYTFAQPFQQGTAVIIICLPQVRRFWMGVSAETMRYEKEKHLRMDRQTKMMENNGNLGAHGPVLFVHPGSTEQETSEVYNAGTDVEAQPKEMTVTTRAN